MAVPADTDLVTKDLYLNDGSRRNRSWTKGRVPDHEPTPRDTGGFTRNSQTHTSRMFQTDLHSLRKPQTKHTCKPIHFGI